MDPKTTAASTKDWINTLKGLTISGFILPYEYNLKVYTTDDFILDFIPTDEMWIWENPEITTSFKRAVEDARKRRITRVMELESYLNML